MAGYYNGFTPAQRARVGRLLRKAREVGEIPVPQVCEACGSNAKVGGHNEDYDNPYDPYHVCYVCHMMLHNRYTAWERWQSYLALLDQGAVFKPITTWLGFRAVYLQYDLETLVVEWGEPRPPSFLHALLKEPGVMPDPLPVPAHLR